MLLLMFVPIVNDISGSNLIWIEKKKDFFEEAEDNLMLNSNKFVRKELNILTKEVYFMVEMKNRGLYEEYYEYKN